MIASNRFIFLAILLVEVSAIPLINVCQQMINNFNHLQSLVPLQIQLYFWNTTAYLSGPTTFKIGSDIILKQCSARSKSATSREVEIELEGSKAFLITDTSVLTLLDINYTTKFDVKFPYGNHKEVSVDYFSVKTGSIFESGKKLTNEEMMMVEKELTKSLLKIVSIKWKQTFDQRHEIYKQYVYNLMHDVYVYGAQDF